MTYLCSITFLIAISSLALTQDCNIDDCSIIEFPEWKYKPYYDNGNYIDLTYNGIIKKMQMANVDHIKEKKDNKYVDAEFNSTDQMLHVYTTEIYKKYYEIETSTSIGLQIRFQCKNKCSRELYFNQKINNTNVFTPKFSQDNYSFEVPLPLHPGFDLNVFQEISAIDYDLTYNKITFYSNDSNIINVTNLIKKIGEKQRYYASLILTKGLVSIDEQLEFTIYAKDNGVPPLISSALITISANIAESLPPQPRFSQILYNGQLGDSYELIAIDKIELDMGTYSENITFSKTGKDENLFKIIPEKNILKIEISRLINADDLKNKTFLQFEIIAANSQLNETGRTSVLVTFPISLEKLYFNKPIYNGKINNDDKLELEDIQLMGEIDNPNKLKVLLSGDDVKYFIYTVEGYFVKIQLKDNVGNIELNGRKFLTMLVEAKLNEVNLASTSIIIDIQKETDLVFSKSMYEGIFNDFKNFTMEDIELLQSSYTETVTFHIEGNDIQYFNYIQKNNIIKISFNGTIYPEEWKLRKFISFFIRAKKPQVSDQTAGILVRLLDQKLEIPEFEKLIYKGKLLSKDNMELEKIYLKNPIKNIQYILSGQEQDYFKFEEKDNEILINNTIPNDILQNKSYLSLTLTAEAEEVKNFTTIIIETPQKPNEDVTIPKFNKYIYKGQIISNTKIDIEIITLKYAINNIEFEITGGFEQYFGIEPNGTKVLVRVTNPIPNNILQSNLHLSLILMAKVRDQLNGNFTTIILTTPEKVLDKPLEFTKILYKGLINTNFEFQIEEIKFKNVVQLKTIYIEGKDEKYFKIAADQLNISFDLKTNLTDDDIRGRKYFECFIVAKTEQGIISRSVVLIEIIIDASSTTETPSTTSTSSTTITTSIIPEPSVPKFEKNFYVFSIKADQIGNFGMVNLDQRENIQIEYKLKSTDEHANARININKHNGELYLTSDVNPGIYIFVATAKTNLSSQVATTNIQILVNPINICGSDTQVQNSLLIKNLPEEQIHYDILSMQQNNCIFEIISILPNDREYFRINETTKMLNSIAIDREDSIFSNLQIVQIQLKLVLKVIATQEYVIPTKLFNHNEITANQFQSFNNSIDERQYILTNSISFDPAVTILSIVIDDINDNRPEFIKPSTSKIIIGYPDSELSDKIFPEKLIEVKAIDKDIGLNATIRYQILQPTNSHFGIDAKSGIIYPFANVLKNVDETTLNVYAIDCDGSPDGLNSSIEIIVKKLRSNHLALLTFESVDRTEINNILNDISSKIGLDLINLNHVTVPSNQKSSNWKFFNGFFSRSEERLTVVMKAWVYSLSDQHIPLDAAILKDKISNVYPNSDIKVEHYEETKKNSSVINITGYIVATSILSVVCICFIGILAWIYYFGPLIYKRLSSPSLDKLPPFNHSNSLEPNAIYQNQVDKSESQLSSYLKRESIKISGTTTKETSSDSSNYHSSLTEDANDETNDDSFISDTESNNNTNDEYLEKRKSIVTFNELVERIDIESDDEVRRDSVCSSIRL